MCDKLPGHVEPHENIAFKADVAPDAYSEEQMRELSHSRLLLVVDLSVDELAVPSDAKLATDRACALRWRAAVPATHSLLHFVLPFNPGHTEYPAGTLRLPVWGAATGTVTYLESAAGQPSRAYDHTDYEDTMFHFNTVSRVSFWSVARTCPRSVN